MNYPITDGENGEVVAVSSAQFDIKKFVFKLIGFLPWIIISVLIAYTIAQLYLRYTPKMHKISAFVLIKDDEESSPDYNTLKELGVITESKEVQNQMDIIQSYELSAAVVDSLNLQISLFSEGRISSSPLYGKSAPVNIHVVKGDSSEFSPSSFELLLSGDKFKLTKGDEKTEYNYNDTFTLAGKEVWFTRDSLIKADPNGYNLVIRDKHSVAVALRGAITVSKANEMGGIIEIAMQDQTPERAIDIINKLIEAYNTAGIRDKNIVGLKTNQFLNERVDTVSKELDVLELKA